MSFLYPFGLLGLIGVPIVIIIYIIKNKYTEQIITSTYLWTLSEKFLKKKRQVTLLSGIISLILQIIAIIAISLLISHPIINIPNSAKEYCFMLDASGSMKMEIDNVSKFDLGKTEIEKIINESTDGSQYTLVYIGSSTKLVYEKLANKEKAIELLNKLEPTSITIDLESCQKYVQSYFNENDSLVTYLVTDKEYSSKNINIINIGSNDKNYAILETNSYLNEGYVTISGTIISYNSSENIDIEISVDGYVFDIDPVYVEQNIEYPFELQTNLTEYQKITVEILNEDGLDDDNISIIYNVGKLHDYSTLIISDRPFYLESVIKTLTNSSIEIIKRDDYTTTKTGYDLYIFDSFSPYNLPTDGTVWIFGSATNIENSGFSVQEVITDEKGMSLTYPKNSTSTFKNLTKGLLKDQIYVSKYVKYGLYRNFTTLLTYQGNPIVFTGTTEAGNREVVFAFDLHDSNLTLLTDYLILCKNLLEYSFPIVLDQTSFTCGDTAVMNVLASFDSIRVDAPNGNVTYLDINVDTNEIFLDEAGIYKITIMEDENAKEFYLFVSLTEEESNPNAIETDFSLQGDLKNNYSTGIYDKLTILFIILAIIFIADWMVYCYEQYQLR